MYTQTDMLEIERALIVLKQVLENGPFEALTCCPLFVHVQALFHQLPYQSPALPQQPQLLSITQTPVSPSKPDPKRSPKRQPSHKGAKFLIQLLETSQSDIVTFLQQAPRIAVRHGATSKKDDPLDEDIVRGNQPTNYDQFRHVQAIKVAYKEYENWNATQQDPGARTASVKAFVHVRKFANPDYVERGIQSAKKLRSIVTACCPVEQRSAIAGMDAEATENTSTEVTDAEVTEAIDTVSPLLAFSYSVWRYWDDTRIHEFAQLYRRNENLPRVDLDWCRNCNKEYKEFVQERRTEIRVRESSMNTTSRILSNDWVSPTPVSSMFGSSDEQTEPWLPPPQRRSLFEPVLGNEEDLGGGWATPCRNGAMFGCV